MPHTLRPAVLADVPALSAFASAHFPDAAPPVVPREFVAAFVSENLDEASFTRYIESGSYSFTLPSMKQTRSSPTSASTTRHPSLPKFPATPPT